MPVIMFKRTCPVHQVEGFPDSLPDGDDDKGKSKTRAFERSCEGSIHASPGATKTVTKDELEVIKKDQLVGGHIQVLVEDEGKLTPVVPEPEVPPHASGSGHAGGRRRARRRRRPASGPAGVRRQQGAHPGRRQAPRPGRQVASRSPHERSRVQAPHQRWSHGIGRHGR